MPPVTHVEFNAISARSLKSLREEGEEEQDDVPSNGVRGDPRLDAFSEPEPREPSAFVLTCKAGLESATVFFKRHAATKLFLRTVKEGNTTEALQCLANNPFLLTYRSFAKDGDTVWHLLAEYGDILLLQALTNYCKIHDIRNLAPRSRRTWSSKEADKDLTISALVNVHNKLHQTPLMFAAYHGRAEVVTFLLQQGADLWAADRCGKRTALHYACIKGHALCVRALLDNLPPEHAKKQGIRYVDTCSASGFTALHFAVACNCVPAILALLAHDAHIDDFNIFDAGEFWISCATKSTPLHIAAISNRLQCAVAILQYFVHNQRRLGLEDPRAWCDKRGNTPLALAKMRGHTELASVLGPGADIPKHLIQADFDVHPVKKLQVIAAQVLKERLLASISEAEEFMKLLGTYQQHGRVFARLAYNSDEQGSSSRDAASHGTGFGGGDFERTEISVGQAATPPRMWGRGVGLAHSTSMSHQNSGHQSGGLPTMMGSHSDLLALGRNPQSLDQPSGSILGEPPGTGGQGGGQFGLAKGSHQSAGGGSSGASGGKDAVGKDRKQAAIKQWLSYERKAIAAGKRPLRRAPLQDRSALSQINPDDAELHWLTSCLTFVGLKPRPVFLPPQVGEDVCGLCHDNKPGLAMESCGHRTCLLCAKSLCYLLDMQQLVLCPFCGSLVTSFTLG